MTSKTVKERQQHTIPIPNIFTSHSDHSISEIKESNNISHSSLPWSNICFLLLWWFPADGSWDCQHLLGGFEDALVLTACHFFSFFPLFLRKEPSPFYSEDLGETKYLPLWMEMTWRVENWFPTVQMMHLLSLELLWDESLCLCFLVFIILFSVVSF